MDQLLEWLAVTDDPNVMEHLVPESSVEQMEHRVLAAADVEIDGHPIVVGLLTDDLPVIVRIQVPEVVPTRPRPLRHGVGFAGVPGSVLLEETPIESTRQRALRIPRF